MCDSGEWDFSRMSNFDSGERIFFFSLCSDLAFCRDILFHEKNPDLEDKNPGDIQKVKNPESRGFCENPDIKKIPNPGDKNINIK